MQLPKPYKREALETYSRRLAKSSLPVGVGKKYKAKKWCQRPANYRQTRKSRGIVFNMSGACRGSLDEVLDLGQSLAREAMEADDTDFAREVINRLKQIVQEYDEAKLLILRAELEAAG